MRRLTALILAVFLAGCTPSPGTENDGGGESTTPGHTADNITLSMRPPDTMHPLYTGQKSNTMIYGLIYDSLVNVDHTLRPAPYLAESCTFSDDRKTIKFKLKEGITWHDGTPFTSNDVYYTFSKIKNPEFPCIYTERLNVVEYITVLDTLHFNIKLSKPYVNILNLLDFPIIPAHISNLDENPVGTGQYKFYEYQPKKLLRLVRNDAWTLDTLPEFAYLDVNLISTSTSEASALKIGKLSAVIAEPKNLGEFGLTENIGSKGFPTLKYEFLGLNLKNAALSAAEVRQAISYALDRTSLLNDAYFGSGSTTVAPIPSFTWFYSSETGKPVLEPEHSAKLLADNGWEDKNGDGVMERTSEEVTTSLRFSILVNEDNASRIKCAEMIAQNLKGIGVLANVKSVPFEDYEKMILEGSYDIFMGGFDFSSNLDYQFAFSSGGEKNYTGYSSPDMDLVIDALYTPISDDEIKKAYLEFQYLFLKDLPVLGLFFLDDVLIHTSNISPPGKMSFSNIYKNINSWEFNVR